MREDSNIMRTTRFSLQTLHSFFSEHLIGTMKQLKDALGTSVDMTIYRKLRQLAYLTSYSHQGKYYTLHDLAHFDSFGLWQFDLAHFSKYGTLLNTAQALIEKSDKGYSLAELRSRVGVDVKEALLQLQKQHRVHRASRGRRDEEQSAAGHHPELGGDDLLSLVPVRRGQVRARRRHRAGA